MFFYFFLVGENSRPLRRNRKVLSIRFVLCLHFFAGFLGGFIVVLVSGQWSLGLVCC